MTNEEAIEYWEQFNAEIDALYDACSEADRDVLVKQREIVEYTISALRQQETVTERHELTNAQKIRAMTDDELNELFHEIYNAGAEDAVSYVWGNRTNNFEWTMEWLQMPAEEDDHA